MKMSLDEYVINRYSGYNQVFGVSRLGVAHVNTIYWFQKPGFATWSTIVACKHLIQVSQHYLLVEKRDTHGQKPVTIMYIMISLTRFLHVNTIS